MVARVIEKKQRQFHIAVLVQHTLKPEVNGGVKGIRGVGTATGLWATIKIGGREVKKTTTTTSQLRD